MIENVGASTSLNPEGLHGLYGDNYTILSFSADFLNIGTQISVGLYRIINNYVL
jgi:hypothetical protein